MKTKALYGFSPQLEPFAGKTAPEQAALLRSWGTTAVFGGHQHPVFVEAAHAVGMKVYVEFACFVHKRWWETVPESRPITADGEPLAPDGWYCGVNPSTPSVRQSQLETLEGFLRGHAVDGVWLDFIRWPCHWEAPDPYLPRTSFDPHTLSRFGEATGIQVPVRDPKAAARRLLHQHKAEWTTWRCVQITSWVTEARAVLRRTRPRAVLGLFGVPWQLSDHEGAIISVIGQDYRALGPIVDVFSPMVYHAMCGQPVEWIGQVAEEVQALSVTPVWPVIQSVDEPATLPAEMYAEALQIALGGPASEGVVVFTLEGVLDQAKLAVTKAMFES